MATSEPVALTVRPDVAAPRRTGTGPGSTTALVAMPFASAQRPSIQIGLLAAEARQAGFRADALHLNLELAAQIGLELYEALCEHRGRLVGEWLFAPAAFGARHPDPDDRLLTDFPDLLGGKVDDVARTLQEVRHEAIPAYLDGLERSVDWRGYQVVGFTSTFQQNLASIALARRLKRQHPELTIVFGGANLEGPMGAELVRSVDCIDLGVSGEADRALPLLLDALEQGTDVRAIPGVIARRADGSVAVNDPAPPFDAMDDLPVPDYDDYYVRAERLGLLPTEGRRRTQTPFESSRGCWWGAKAHCTFCGLNGSTMSYRRKSAARVAAELATLNQRYRVFDFEAVDNILEPSYLEDLFGALEADEHGYQFFYEVKANLGRHHLRALARGGVRRIQPGIESLDSHVLGLMRKGVRASHNVNLLRWARYYGIEVGWNLIWGFPDEREEDYQRQAALLPDLVHLQPPLAGGRLWLERFSPLFRDREAFPARSINPEASYAYAYPDDVQLDDLAYFFDYELERTLTDEVYEGVTKAIAEWQAAWEAGVPPTLTLWRGGGLVQIDDHRHTDRAGTHTFEGPLADLYLAIMETPRSATKARAAASLAHDVDEVEDALDGFVTRGLALRDGNLFLALALPGIEGR